ncbi:hypothetical protein AMTR_s00001p00254670 [Amborella trichopoda]|uniref:FAD-binding FR-type domain-containing protein n=1 Tax=Amborella trichopoda TaxID=13333 RepID=W1NLR2_AMBTC|nr:hypothetical protein AMTR_s00001p00254670 [Amborella trichopoda]
MGMFVMCMFYRGEKQRLEAWSRPVIVKGPLGIVSAMELACLLMFVALLVYSFSTYLSISFSKLKPGQNPMWQAKLSSVALRFGLVGNVCAAFLFIPVARGSVLLQVLGIGNEAGVKYHIWLGHITMTLFTAHGLSYSILFAAGHKLELLGDWEKTGVSIVAGVVALSAGIVMWVTTLKQIRERMFELFYYAHHLYFVFILFYVLHVGAFFFTMILPGVYLFLIDRFLRFLQSRRKVRLISSRILPCETVELTFTKQPGLKYNPLSMVFVNVPSISSLQWHPFTVTSNSKMEVDKLSVVVKSEGSWSRRLFDTVSMAPALEHLDVHIEGPYGPSSCHFLRHDALVLISGGSGITPFMSVVRELVVMSGTLGSPVPSILMICAFRNSDGLSMLDVLLPPSSPSISGLDLRIEAFITRGKPESEGNDRKDKLLRAVWFKPSRSEAPVSAILGPTKSWLWMGAIISSSFVMFLLLLGITERYYVYPIDHNTGDVYPTGAHAMLNVLFVCVSIATMATLAVMWNRRHSPMEMKQIQNLELPTPTTSPSAWSYNADRELESLPQQSLLQATNIHIGARPDLTKMLESYGEASDGSSIGVMVCGPDSMRDEAAAFCSSALAYNFHFESLNFTF